MSAVRSTSELVDAAAAPGEVTASSVGGQGSASVWLVGRTAYRAALVLCVVVIAALAFTKLAGVPSEFPEGVSLPLGERAEQLTEWSVGNLVWFYAPLTQFLDGTVAWILYGLYVVPPPALVLTLAALTWKMAGARVALLTLATLGLTVAFGLWEPMKETLALMTVAVTLACAIGIVVGVVASASASSERVVRLLLDAMQTYPMFAYLVPALAIFGAGTTSALVVTLIWAMPPVTRLTLVGIRAVPIEANEAAHSLGVTKIQLLWKVLLPMARPSIRAGINQTIMFAMTMAIIASMIGAGGLGDPVWTRLRLLQFGPALEAGIILVLMAIVMDRATSTDRATKPDPRAGGTPSHERWSGRSGHRRDLLKAAQLGLLIVAAVALSFIIPRERFDFSEPPSWAQLSLEGRIDSTIDWLNITWGAQFDALNNLLQDYAINPAVDALAWLPWPAALVAVFAVAFGALGWRGGLFAVCSATVVGMLGVWSPAVYTFGFVAVAAAMTVVIGIPLGVVASQSNRFAALIRPILDAMQTLPIFLFVIPSVVLLGPGPVAGLLATVAFAIPPVVRLTNTAVRGTDPDIVEAAQIFGTTRWQMLTKVRLTLGLPTILVGLNQAVMLALAMAVVSAFIGTPGLGQLILLSVSDADLALGVQTGVAMFLVAVVTDRVMHGVVRTWARNPHSS